MERRSVLLPLPVVTSRFLRALSFCGPLFAQEEGPVAKSLQVKRIIRSQNIWSEFLAVVLILVISVAATPQSVVADGQSSSLQTTMTFLQEELSSLGPTYTTFYWTNGVTGRRGVSYSVYQITEFRADSDTCHISYSLANPNSRIASDLSFDLKDVENVREVTAAQYMKELHTANGHPEIDNTSDPPEFVVVVKVADGSASREFWLLDEDLANRVAKALSHATKLCTSSQHEQPPVSANPGSSSPSGASASHPNVPQETPPMNYESCSWTWTVKGIKGWHVSVSPVHEVIDNIHPKCRAFGRWVLKNHADMNPDFYPDAPRDIGASYGNGRPIEDSVYETNGEASAARQRYLNKQNDGHTEVEELEWTP